MNTLLQNKTILVVDDDANTCEAVCSALEEAGGISLRDSLLHDVRDAIALLESITADYFIGAHGRLRSHPFKGN